MTRRRLIAGLCLVATVPLIYKVSVIILLPGMDFRIIFDHFPSNFILHDIIEFMLVIIAFAVLFSLLVFTKTIWAVWGALVMFGLACWPYIGRHMQFYFQELPKEFPEFTYTPYSYFQDLITLDLLLHFILPLGFFLCLLELWSMRSKRLFSLTR